MRHRTRGAALALALIALAAATAARAQVCTTGPRVTFAGHNFPLDSVPDPTPLNAVLAFPNVDLNEPLFLSSPPDGTDRLFVVERTGRIRILPATSSGSVAPVFLDLSAEIATGPEQGLLGLAFDPAYASNRRFYVDYIAAGSRCSQGTFCTKVVRYQASASNPDQADLSTRLEILEVPRDGQYHNGGMLAFGPDGMLYISQGDDNGGVAQNLGILKGKLLRIDTRVSPYAIPPDNPFVGVAGARGEVWAYGLRNPWRFSFDRLTGDLWIGDVGNLAWEEVDYVPAGVPFNRNFGWPICEGTHDWEGDCSAFDSNPPIIEYPHDSTGGLSVIGGYVYRGDRLPALYGAYLYGDWAYQRIWAKAGLTGPSVQIAGIGMNSFGEDQHGEVYPVWGDVYRLEMANPGTQQFPTTLTATGLFTSVSSLTPKPGLIEYDVSSPLWSDRARKRRWIALPGTSRIQFSANGNWVFPVGTVFVKHFELPATPTTWRRIETRVLLRQVDRWVGYTYRWNSGQTEANLVTSEETGTFTVDVGGTPTQQTWLFPSPSGCLSCHTPAGGRVLGVRTAQLNRAFTYPGGSDNELHAWGSCLGLFDQTLLTPSVYPSYADPASGAETLNARARSYMAANCAHCHAPGGPAPGGLDLRYAPLLGDMNVIGVAPTAGTLGLPNAQRVRVGVKAQSVLWARVGSTDPAVRMPKGSLVPDPLAVSLLGTWIDTGLGVIDSDGDGRADASDNCRYQPNADQMDAGRWLTLGSDGIGDACQCLDVTPVATVNMNDLVRLRAYLTGNLTSITPGIERRSNHPSASGAASVVDAARLRRSLEGEDPPPAQLCPAATALHP